jgi:hypothetical protein
MAGELSHALDACHCSQGRKQTGHYFVSTNLERGALTLRRDESLRGHRRSRNVRRGSCPECGTTLFQGPDKGGRDFIAVAMGALEAPTGVRPPKHISVVDKGDYYNLTDRLPQRDGH